VSTGELFRASRLPEAIDAQLQEVKNNPGDQARRLFLFELLAFAGDLDRAQRQVDALKYDELELQTALMAYRRLLDAERLRRKVFGEGAQPQFLLEPTPQVALRLEALARLREDRPADAVDLLRQAEEASPVLKGQLNGKPFEGLRDADDLFGGVLEVMAQGGYYWVPLEQIESLVTKPPKFPRDLLWLPARLDTASAAGEVFLPTLYPGSHEHADDQVKLGRLTDWQSAEGGPVLGRGARVFLAGDEGVNVVDWRELQIG